MLFDNRELIDYQYLVNISNVERYLLDIQSGRKASPIVALWNLRLLQDKLRHAEHYGLSSVCAEIETRIIALSNDVHCRERAAGVMELVDLLRQGSSRMDDPIAVPDEDPGPLLKLSVATSL